MLSLHCYAAYCIGIWLVCCKISKSSFDQGDVKQCRSLDLCETPGKCKAGRIKVLLFIVSYERNLLHSSLRASYTFILMVNGLQRKRKADWNDYKTTVTSVQAVEKAIYAKIVFGLYVQNAQTLNASRTLDLVVTYGWHPF